MRFDIVSDPAKIARIQKRLADRDQQQKASRGALVRYELPALLEPRAFLRFLAISGAPRRWRCD